MPEHVRRAMEKEGVSIPEPVEEDLELVVGDFFYFMAFTDLDSERTYGEGGLNPIPTSAIVLWAGWNGLDYNEVQDLIYVIRKIDNGVVKHAAEKRKKDLKNGKNNIEGVRKQDARNPKKGGNFR
jgi:hypothetical protein